MKNISGFMIAVAFILSISAMTANAQRAGFVLGGPQTNVDFTNNTDQAVRIVIGNKTLVVGPHGKQARVRFNSFTNPGDIRVDVTLCSAVSTFNMITSAPTDENFPLGDLAITDDYLATRPDMKSLHEKVKAIEQHIKGQPGDKGFKNKLEAWLKYVDKNGLEASLNGCESQYTFPAKIPWQSANYDYGYYGDPLFNVFLEQDAEGHRQFRSGGYIVSY